MGISSAISATLSGLRATEAGLEIVSRNVANADTPGYTRKSLRREDIQGAGVSFGVRAAEITREIDILMQKEIWRSNSAYGNADILNQYLSRMDGLFGAPGSPNSFDAIFNNFTESIQELTTSPDSVTVRQNVISNAQVLTQQMHQLTEHVQLMRQEADNALAGLTLEANDALQQLSIVSTQLTDTLANGKPLPDLLDERDRQIDRLSNLMDLNVVEADNGTVLVTTESGIVLFDGTAASLQYDPRGVITPQAQYDLDPAERGVGTIQFNGPSGFGVDLLQPGLIRSGQIAAYAQVRDEVLVEAQAQLDELARSLSQAFSTVTTAGTAATAGAQTGFDLDLSSLQAGNSFSVTTTVGGNETTYTFVRVDDASTLPLSDAQTADPNDTVVGVDFSGGFAAAVATINAALGADVTASDQGGNVLRILDDGAVGNSDVDAASSRITQTSLTGGGPEFSFFTDKDAVPFTGALDNIPQQTGFAGRIQVNSALVADNSRLVIYNTAPQTGAGDSTRPFFILNALTDTDQLYAPASGIGTSTSPYLGSPADFAQQMVNYQSGKAAAAEKNLSSRQTVADVLSEKFARRSSVNVDKEMADLLALQNAYAANARILQVVDEMLNDLLNF